ncbi:MAG TPA: molybdate ABC transporter substrate-binding protein [Panacibacter sp.]|nr:molybdate ABC transporter substrate-binding protein [Panacibacter sp.]
MKKAKVLMVALFIGLTVFGKEGDKKVTVAVAANMQYAMNALKAQFEKETGIKVEVILGSSGKLTQQIQEGAPFDIFISADTKYPQTLWQGKFATDTPKIYANGVLVLWTARNNLKPEVNLQILLMDDVKKIAIANPKTAPYGAAAEEILKRYKLYNTLQKKLVYGESISQTNQFIMSQAADIGFTAKSAVVSDELKGKGSWVEIAHNAYSAIEQAAVILKHGAETNKEASEKFYTYLYSAEAKKIYKRFGYIVK